MCLKIQRLSFGHPVQDILGLEEWADAIQFVEREPIEKEFVSNNAVQHKSYVYLENPVLEFGVERRLVAGILYPEPGGVYTIHNPTTNLTYKGQKVVWATPSLAVSFRPELRGIEIVLDD